MEELQHAEVPPMKIDLTREQETIVNDELKTGQFRTAEEVISEALQALRHKTQSSSSTGANGAQREAVREMLAFVEKNRVSREGVPVQDLIHEGHRR
jgi:Arc/MetJ-type ribon-helix-helix transcriptional regulator